MKVRSGLTVAHLLEFPMLLVTSRHVDSRDRVAALLLNPLLGVDV